MAKVYYLGKEGKRQGPFTEAEAQAWYASGFFSSGVKFQVTVADHADPNGPYHTLAELIELNGKILPFYFAPERETRENKQEATLNQLAQDVESLRVSSAFRRNEKEVAEAIAVLRSQVESLVESHADLLLQVNAVSGQKDNSPVAPQLEKRVSELKERVDKQEKNYASMRKELSAVISKSDRNETKLERLMEKQQEVEAKVTGYDKRIGDLKASEKSIRDSLNECEQNAASSVAQLELITSDLNELRKEIAEEKKATLSEMEKSEAPLRNEIRRVRENDERTGKEQSAAAASPLVEVSVSVPPWEKREAEKTPVAAAAPKSDVAVEKKQVKAPWESDKTTAAAVEKKQENRAPWDDDKGQPELEPWNRTENDSVGTKKPEEKGPSIDQKVKPAPAAIETATAAVKPVSRVKDWNAICRELDSDDEEEKPLVAPDPHSLASVALSLEYARNFTNDFLALLSCYCSALDSGAMTMLAQLNWDYNAMFAWQAAAVPNTHGFEFIREQLRDRVKKLAQQICMCLGCGFMMMTPRMLVGHFISAPHGICRLGSLSPEFDRMTTLIGAVFLRFVISLEQMETWTAADVRTILDGGALYRAQRDPSRFRPTIDFQKEIAWKMTRSDPTAPLPASEFVDGVVVSSVPVVIARMKELAGKARAWLACKKRRRQLQADFDKHLAEGVPACAVCTVAFESADDFYDHVANSYDHAHKDQSLIAMCMWAWKGNERWDAAM